MNADLMTSLTDYFGQLTGGNETSLTGDAASDAAARAGADAANAHLAADAAAARQGKQAKMHAAISTGQTIGTALQDIVGTGNGRQPQITARASEQLPQQTQPDHVDSTALLANFPQYAASSKKLKKKVSPDRAAVRRGLAGEDPIDANGMQIVRIKQLSQKLEGLRAQVAALRKSKGKA